MAKNCQIIAILLLDEIFLSSVTQALRLSNLVFYSFVRVKINSHRLNMP
jgi:hypothetical protein